MTAIKMLMTASSTVSDMEILGCYLGWDSRGSGWSNDCLFIRQRQYLFRQSVGLHKKRAVCFQDLEEEI